MLQHEYMTKMLFILRYRLSVQLLNYWEEGPNFEPHPSPPKKPMNYNPKKL